jgi:glycosyltransferase involved in cell wall biosynthesis
VYLKPSIAMRLINRTILQIIPGLDAGGAERTTVDIAEALAKAGARPLVLARGGRLVPELEKKGGVFIPFPAHSKNPVTMLVSAIKLAQLIRREKADLVHARSRAPAWVALWACKLARVPLVTTWHGSYSAKSGMKRFYNSVMGRGNAVIANSSWTARRIIAGYPPARDRITVIPRGTDLTRFAPESIAPEGIAAMRTAWGAAVGEKIILLAARLTPWKGHRVLLDAAAQLVAQGQNIKIVFAGDAQGRVAYVEELKAQAERLGLTSHLHFAGHVENIPLALAASDCVAVPSVEPEAFGRVAVEAQAMGKPVIVTDNGAMAETVLAPPSVLPDKRTGWIVPPDDAQSLAQALDEALNLPLPMARILAAAGARQAQKYTLHAMAEATLAVYAQILRGSE